MGVLSAELGEEDRALRIAARLRRVDPSDIGAALASGIEAHLAWRAGDPSRVLRALEGTPTQQDRRLEPFRPNASHRFLRAAALEALGRGAEALPIYASFREPGASDLVYAAPAALGSAHILAVRGDRSGAATEYARAADLWSDADPELRAIARSAARISSRLTAARR